MREFLEITSFSLFCGLGGEALGFSRGSARYGNLEARFRCLGGVDADPASCRDFTRLVGVPATQLDLFDREQYRDFHGHEPPPDWREVTPEDLRAAAGGEAPDVLVTSPPCKGLSALLPEGRAASPKYQALNRLTLRGIMLALEAWADDLPAFVLLENVPGIARRGRRFLDGIVALLEGAGYSVAETVHDCGEIGGLAQHRRRFLLVARHREKVAPFLYEPPKRRVLAVGEILDRLPVPGGDLGGPMHRLRPLTWRTWLRLALIPAGKDWRALQDLRVVDGHLADVGLVPGARYFRGTYGVQRWGEASGTVTGEAAPSTGRFAVADPRVDLEQRQGSRSWQRRGVYGVLDPSEPASCVTGSASVDNGAFAVADPRCNWSPNAHRNKLRVGAYSAPSGTVIGTATQPLEGAICIADPRLAHSGEYGQLGVRPWSEPFGTVTASSEVGGGRFAIADPRRPEADGRRFNNVYRLVDWSEPSPAVTGGAGPSSGGLAVADPRAVKHSTSVCRFSKVGKSASQTLPDPSERCVPLIVALDGTWHRPLTTLELAALQGLVDLDQPEPTLELDGTSDSKHRERIGNAIPVGAAAAVASVIGHAMLLAHAGETFVLASTPVWARDIARMIALDGGGVADA